MMRRWLERVAVYLAYAGALGMLASLVVWLITRRFDLWAEIPLAVGSILVAAFVLLRPAAVRQALTGRPARGHEDALLVSLAFMALLVLANFLANRHSVRVDLTADESYSLSPQTVSILRGLNEPIRLTGFFVGSDPVQAQAEMELGDLLEEYRFLSDKISYEFVDPELKPALASQYGITREGTLVLEQGQKRQETFAADEQSLTAAILKVSRDAQKAVYFLSGHAERDPGSPAEDGYAQIAGDLQSEGYRIETLDLSASGATLPADMAALIVAAPQTGIGDQERAQFAAYLSQGGRVLLLCDPGGPAVDAELLKNWGLRAREDLVIDRPNTLFGDVASPMVVRYPWHPITHSLGGITTFFPYARSLELAATAPANVQVQPLVETSKESWGEVALVGGKQLEFNAEQDTAGPLVIAAAAQELTRHGRLVVFGNSLFVANSVLSSVHGAFGNSELFVNAVDWLTEDDEVIAIGSAPPAQRLVVLTRAQMNMVLYSSAILLPLAILALGFATWWSNR